MPIYADLGCSVDVRRRTNVPQESPRRQRLAGARILGLKPGQRTKHNVRTKVHGFVILRSSSQLLFTASGPPPARKSISRPGSPSRRKPGRRSLCFPLRGCSQGPSPGETKLGPKAKRIGERAVSDPSARRPPARRSPARRSPARCPASRRPVSRRSGPWLLALLCRPPRHPASRLTGPWRPAVWRMARSTALWNTGPGSTDPGSIWRDHAGLVL